MKVFMAGSQLNALYSLLNLHWFDAQTDEELMVVQCMRELRLQLMKRVIKMAEDGKNYTTIKITVVQAYALRVVLSRMGWVAPLEDSVRVYLLCKVDAHL